ncbi:L-histidine N(alpha)-methyltransferase [Rickettsiales endosymbiont of Trichoplax sp. H2]|uniref:L-histidine N(alpha)-methyltransferase n=1 Tax=Rickettsiales endosymbiont of Trichoplax sp. H2 TaxID=2021221 RepID=UPI0012B3744A|nr:L-histidine N(alpha)-methyltransferase [Rickettsiales endosymbiont of Trichoplax sp. H2]MSO13522.1 hypothetical protein [Rickettsiales endosymbiont of Trichoplax sp. H2]
MEDNILKDFYDLFAYKKTGHLTKYGYLGKVDYYKQILEKEEKYYVSKSEIELIHNSKIMSDIIKDYSIFYEIGPGPRYAISKKTIPFLSHSNKLKKYYAIDCHKEYANAAANVVSSYFKDIKAKGICLDITKKHNLSVEPKSCVFMLGTCLANLTNEENISILNSIRVLLCESSVFIISFDTTQNKQVIYDAYKNNSVYQFYLNMLRVFGKSTLSKNFDPELFSHLCEIVESSDDTKMQGKLVANKSQSFTLGNDIISIEKGAQYHLVNSRKFKKNYLQTLLSFCRFKVIDVIKQSNNNLVFFILKK